MLLRHGVRALHTPATAAQPTVVLPTEANRNGYQYVCSSSGTSGAAEPNWASATTVGSTVTDGGGGLTWTNGGLIPPNSLGSQYGI